MQATIMDFCKENGLFIHSISICKNSTTAGLGDAGAGNQNILVSVQSTIPDIPNQVFLYEARAKASRNSGLT